MLVAEIPGREIVLGQSLRYLDPRSGSLASQEREAFSVIALA